MTLTISIAHRPTWRPGWHVSRRDKPTRSVRVWWLWFAVAWYRLNDHDLVTEPHEWSK